MLDLKSLISNALEARKKAYVPYSKFKVGAALLTSEGEIYNGFNIENSAYSASNCAERTAFFRAIYEGKREFRAIAVVGGMEDEEDKFKSYTPPCGVCRQVMREFCVPDKFEIILAKGLDDYKIFTLEQLLPNSFGPNNLN